jgi:general secretion pathway protein G
MKKGFTLIELMIVVMIIGILAVVFLPKIFGSTVDARNTARKADIQTIAEALQAASNGGVNVYQGGDAVDDGCVSALSDVYLPYFPGGSIPSDPNDLSVSTCGAANGGYYIQTYTAAGAPFKYGIFARMEGEEEANVRCGQVDNDPPRFVDDLVNDLPLEANCKDGTNCCYGVRYK